MGSTASVVESKSQSVSKESLLSDYDDDTSSNAYQNLLRLTILENIRLEFQRPTTVLLYGCPHSCLDNVSQFLAKKLEFKIMKCELNQLVPSENQPVSDSPTYGEIYQNYPQTFEQVLTLQSMTKGSQIVVIFLNSSYAGIIRSVQMEWIHPPSGRNYHITQHPPLSMEGTPNNPSNLLDDITHEPLVQKVTRDQCVRDLMAYDKMKIEMWSRWVSFRHCVNADVEMKVLEHELVKLMCGIIAEQSSGLKRVITSSGGVKVRSTVPTRAV